MFGQTLMMEIAEWSGAAEWGGDGGARCPMVFVPIGSAHRARSSSLPRDEIGPPGGLERERGGECDIYLYRANEAPYLMESPVLDMGHGRSI